MKKARRSGWIGGAVLHYPRFRVAFSCCMVPQHGAEGREIVRKFCVSQRDFDIIYIKTGRFEIGFCVKSAQIRPVFVL